MNSAPDGQRPTMKVNGIIVDRACGEVILRIPKQLAEEIQGGLSDILCWCQGFEAAGKEGPMGTEPARKINMALKVALNEEKD